MLKQLDQAPPSSSIPLATAVQDPDRSIQEKAKESREHQDAIVTVNAVLREALRDRKGDVRAAAALAITQIDRIPGYLAALVEVDTDKRAAAFLTIKQIYQESPEVINALIVALHASDTNVRIKAAWALGKLGKGTSEVTGFSHHHSSRPN